MRPQLHFTAASGWINDPHGVTYHDGRYHLFHQYVPGSPVWTPACHWGHATSADLLAWDRRPVALAPGDGDDGIWTGSLVPDAGGARIFYTSVAQPDLGLGRIRVATADDAGWERWTKGAIVVRPPGELDLIAFRDPFLLREQDGWRMLVGAATRAGDALALTYTSPDLDTWRYDGVAARRSTSQVDPVWMGALWECPQVVEVDGHWVMLSSVWDADVLHYAGYGIGGADAFEGGRLTPTDWGRLSFGGSYYAPSFFRDRDALPCVLLWMRGVDDADEGWTGCLSLPHVLSVHHGRLVATPHPAVAAARGALLDPGEHASAYDLEWSPDPRGDRLVLASGAVATASLAVGGGELALDRPGRETWSLPWSGEPVRVLVDGPVIEVSSTRGILGGPIDPATTWQPVSGDCRAWTLVGRPAP